MAIFSEQMTRIGLQESARAWHIASVAILAGTQPGFDSLSPIPVGWQPISQEVARVIQDMDLSIRGAPDSLTMARYFAPGSVELSFADQFVRLLPLRDLGLNLDEIRPNTSRATTNGLVIQATDEGEAFVIDSATLRYICDPDYAARMDATVNALLIPSEHLEGTAHRYQPPQEWYDQPEDRD